MNRYSKYFIAIMAIILIGGCSSSGKKAVEKLYYRFPDTTHSNTENLNILVKRPTALGIIGNRPMVVQTDEGALKQMHDNFWLDSPKILLFNYLNKTFHSTANNKANKANKNILFSEILHLEKQQNMAILEIKFNVFDSTGALIFSKTYFNELTSSGNSISAFSKSISIMLDKMIKQLIKDMQ